MEPAVLGIRERLGFGPRARQAFAPLLAGLALVVGGLACNAPLVTGGSLLSTTGGSHPVEEIADAATSLLDRWGDRHAFFAVMAALDHGYSAQQVIDNVATVAPDGTIAGVGPAGPALGLLSPTGPGGEGPPGEAGLGAAARIIPAARLQGDSPADQYVADVDGWLSEIWQAGQEAIREDEPVEAEDEEAAEMLEQSVAMLTLELAGRGYSGDQIVEALLLDSLSDRGFAMGCYYIAGPNGAPVQPANEPIASMQGSCPPLDVAADAGDVSRFDGTYLGTELEQTYSGAVPEVLETEITVEIVEGVLDAELTKIVVGQTTWRPVCTCSERIVQTVRLEARVDSSGTFEGRGTTSASYTLLSCEPEKDCEGVSATVSKPGGVEVSVSGAIVDDTLTAEIINSVSGDRSSFEAERIGQ